jgi:hypothetical protein
MPVARDLSWMAEDDAVAGNAGSNLRKLHHYPTVALAVGSPVAPRRPLQREIRMANAIEGGAHASI